MRGPPFRVEKCLTCLEERRSGDAHHIPIIVQPIGGDVSTSKPGDFGGDVVVALGLECAGEEDCSAKGGGEHKKLASHEGSLGHLVVLWLCCSVQAGLKNQASGYGF